ncbi:phosphomevalonate kinase [Dinochytrium kinnereticum]|nr:phosphomevalonate kinase [Dinochytrium kinnereticum]
MRRTTVSAPGKVLVTGGYLVLDREFSGLVVSTNARFYTTVSSSSLSTASSLPKITVRSPQFLDGLWEYEMFLPADSTETCCKIVPTKDVRNRYVECALVHALNVASVLGTDFTSRAKKGLDITILGDNDFYSQRAQLEKKGLPLNSKSLSSLDRFCSTLTSIPNVSKTGLGSSAAMITSLTAAILSYFEVTKLNVAENFENDLAFVHNVAQFAHCLAQGKIGSGFDVSAAVYGGHSYRRFSPDALSELLQKTGDPLSDTTLSAADIVEKLQPAKATRWDSEVGRFRLPPGFKMMLADIDAGSNTPKLVSQVLKWRATFPDEARALWLDLHEKNKKCEDIFRSLCAESETNPEEYWKALANISSQDKEDSSVRQKLEALQNTFQQVRHLLREMSTKANVPIEPAQQTLLLDACSKVPGVVMAGVPGAGGFDAIFVIYVEYKDVAPRQKVEDLWSSWTEMDVGPLLAGEDFSGIKLEKEFSHKELSASHS